MRYYILFENYEQALALHDLLDRAGVENRIAPAPASIRVNAGCGVSLLVTPECIERARAVIEETKAAYYDIASLQNELKPKRDRYC